MVLGFISIIMFLPGVFVEHNMAAKEFKALKGNMDTGKSLPSPKWYALLALMVVFFLHRVNITITER